MRAGRLTPPVGFPLARGDVLVALRSALGKASSGHRLGRHLADALGVRWGCPISSGRAGLALLLEILHRRAPGRDEVVVPAYTCYSVPSSIVRAGLRVRMVDLAPQGFAWNRTELEAVTSKRTLAIVATHLLGYPIDLRPIRAVTQAVRATLIDDAAQALGARLDGQAAGGGGDAGILSFGRGKPLTALGGGAVLCDDPQLIRPLEETIAALPRPPVERTACTALVATLYSPLLHPELYWLPARLPFLRIGVTEFNPTFLMRRLDGFRIGLILRGLARVDAVNEARRRSAERFARALRGIEGLELVSPAPESYAIYLRFPVLLPDVELRDRAMIALRIAGIGASCLYPEPLTGIPAIRERSPDGRRIFPNAERMAKRLLCLPTYPHVDDRVVERAAEILSSVLKERTSRSVRPTTRAGNIGDGGRPRHRTSGRG